MKQCANHDQLEALINEMLHPDELSLLSQHIESCEHCQLQLEELTSAEKSNLIEKGEGSSNLQRPDPDVIERMSQHLFRQLEPPTNREDPGWHELTKDSEIGDYRIIELIGRGGMGTVYLARHSRLDREVAIKILEGDHFADKGRIARFQRESKAMGRLRHPNVVTAFDAGEFNSYHYLAMEYVDGVDLDHVIKNEGCLEPADACEIVRQAAIGLQHVFETGLIHRDLKPSNIMLARSAGDVVVKLLDLGLAQFADAFQDKVSLTQSGQIMGTLDYMAPEQFGGREVDIRADIYSLGATLYALLCGQPPFSFKGNNLLEKIRQRAIQPVQPISERRPDLPTQLTRFVDQMLQNEVSARPATPQLVADGMQQFAAGHKLTKLNLAPASSANKETLSMATCEPTWPAFDKQPSLPPQQNSRSKALTGIARWRLSRWIAGAVIGFLMILSGIIVLHQTDGGRITVTSTDPNLKIEVVRNQSDVKVFEVQQLEKQTWFRSGEYEIRLPRESDDKVTIKGNQFTLVRGGKKTVSIEVTPPTGIAKFFVPDTKSFFTIESKARANQVLEVLGARAEKFTNILLAENSSADHQQFHFVPAEQGLYFIESKLRPKLGLDIINWGRMDQTNIHAHIRGKVTTAASKFKLLDRGDGFVSIVSSYDDNLFVGVADDDQNIVARRGHRGNRTIFKLNRTELVPESKIPASKAKSK